MVTAKEINNIQQQLKSLNSGDPDPDLLGSALLIFWPPGSKLAFIFTDPVLRKIFPLGYHPDPVRNHKSKFRSFNNKRNNALINDS